MQLNSSNYYTKEAAQAYWSASAVKTWLDCPARGLAEMRGEYARPASSALLIGGYVDACFEGTAVPYMAAHPEMLKRTGELKAEFIQAGEMVIRARRDPFFMDFCRGETQRIFTGEIGGYPFRGKFDFYLPGERIVDLKTVRDFEPVYKPGQGKLNFADAWNWPLQMAIYQALEGNQLPCFLAVITKETPPDIAVIQIPQDKLDAELEYLIGKMQYFDAIKQGVIEPDGCGRCAYCRETKELSRAVVLGEDNEV